MAPKRKTYIKNCTGEGCESSNSPESRKIIGRIVFYVLLATFFCSLIYVLFFSMQVQINNVEISGTKELDSSKIKKDLEDNLQGKYLNVVPKNNFLFISAGRVQKKLEENYKKIRTAEVEKKFPDTLKVKIDEHEALLIWCKSDENCFLLDEDGIAYNVADFGSSELIENNLLQIGDDSGAEVIVGAKIMESRYEQYLLDLKDSMQSLGIELEPKYYTPSRMAEEVKIKSTAGFWIYLSTQFSLESAVKTLNAVLKKEIPKEKISELEYVDLRSEYKAFYKFKNVDEEKKEREMEGDIKSDK